MAPARAEAAPGVPGHKRPPFNKRIPVERHSAARSSSFRRLWPAPADPPLQLQLLLLLLSITVVINNTATIPVSGSALPGSAWLTRRPAGLSALAPAAVHQNTDNKRQNYEPAAADQWAPFDGGDDDDDNNNTTSSGGDSNLDLSLNKSLTLLDGPTSASNDSNLGGMRRQLIRQLTSLIMNHEPERIAERMEGTRVSGQLVSESEPFEVDGRQQPSAELPINSANTVISESRHQQLSKQASSFALGQPLSPSMLVAGSGAAGDGDYLMAVEDVRPPITTAPPGPADQDQASNETAASEQSGPGSSSTNKAAAAAEGAEEPYVTCSPDYEDSSMVEMSSNLTQDQQQQLLLGADSAGLLGVTNASNTAPGEPGVAGAGGEQGGSQLQPTRQPAANTCVMPGSRMIEVITKVITPILFSIIIVVGLLGNIIVMIVILEDRKTEREYTPTGLLILDLSLADLSFIVFCIPFTAWDYSVGHWVFGSLWCKFNQYLIVVCALSSIYTLVLMSVDRFLAIVYPIECIAYRTSKNTLYAIYIKWILILAMASPTVAMHGLIDSPAAPDQYTCRFLADQYNPLHFQIVFFITSYLFPLILIFCLYLSLLNKLWFGSRPHGHKESMKTLESKKKVTWLVASIVIVFALCWCPIQVMLILMRLKSHKITATYVAIQVFSHTLGYMNSCVNPIVYAFASESFLNSFKRCWVGRLCYTCFCIKNSHTSQTNNHHTNNNNNNNNHHNQPHDQERTVTNFRATMHNNAALKDTSFHHQSSTQTRSGLSTREVDINTLDAAINGHHHTETKPPTRPLEPRDRILPPSGSIEGAISQLSRFEPNKISAQDEALTSTQQSAAAQISSSVGAQQQQQAPAKQQLVARMVQSGNQAPCYQQEVLKSP